MTVSKKNLMKKAIVVGSGIAGILSAILLKRKFNEVHLIEKESELGGLLKSFRNGDGIEFDYGTHFLRDTGNRELDTLLFGQNLSDNWLVLDFLKAGNFFGGKLNEHSPFIDSSCLPEEIYQKGMTELLGLGFPKENYENLEEQLRDSFGYILTERIFQPALQKFFGHSLGEIAPNANHFFIPSRLLGFNPETTRELKKSAVFDGKLGFHSYQEGLSSSKNYYPKYRGIGLWIEELTEKLEQLGVKIIAGQSVSEILYNNFIHSVVLEDGTRFSCDQLIWTVPVFLFNKACKFTSPAPSDPPTRLISGLHHFVLDQPFLTDLYFFSCYDPGLITFRVTLYANVRKSDTSLNSQYPLTVEVLSQQVPDLKTDSQTVFEELKKMGVISTVSKVLFQHSEIVQGGFPVPTDQFIRNSKSQLEFAKTHFSNVLFLGKSTGSSWFMHEVLLESYSAIMELLDS